MNQPTEGIVSKIRKLHALSERASTEAEAALAATRIQELLFKHNLDLGQIVLKEDPGETMEVGRAWRRLPSHVDPLMRACERLFDVRGFFRGARYHGHRVVFIGLRANVEAAALTYAYLVESIESLVQGAKTNNLIYGTVDFQDFRFGAATRIKELARQRKDQTMAADPRYGDLVHLGEALAKQMWSALHFSGSRGGWGGLGGSKAYSHGYEQGSRIDVSGGRTGRMIKSGE